MATLLHQCSIFGRSGCLDNIEICIGRFSKRFLYCDTMFSARDESDFKVQEAKRLMALDGQNIKMLLEWLIPSSQGECKWPQYGHNVCFIFNYIHSRSDTIFYL